MKQCTVACPSVVVSWFVGRNLFFRKPADKSLEALEGFGRIVLLLLLPWISRVLYAMWGGTRVGLLIFDLAAQGQSPRPPELSGVLCCLNSGLRLLSSLQVHLTIKQYLSAVGMLSRTPPRALEDNLFEASLLWSSQEGRVFRSRNPKRPPRCPRSGWQTRRRRTRAGLAKRWTTRLRS